MTTSARTIDVFFHVQGPDLGATTREPCLWEVLFQYYKPHFPANEAKRLADRYINAVRDASQERAS